MEDDAYVKVEVNAPLTEIDGATKDAGLDAECFETDALTGDPATIALIALVSTDVIRAIQLFVSAMVKRDKKVEISVGKIRIKAASPTDAEKLFDMLDKHLKDGGAHEK